MEKVVNDAKGGNMSILIKSMEIPTSCRACHLKMNCEDCEGLEYVCLPLHQQIGYLDDLLTDKRRDDCPLVPVTEHGRLRKRIVNRGDVFNAIEAARINALDGIFTDRYKDGFHDGLKRALEILANDVQDVPTIIKVEEC